MKIQSPPIGRLSHSSNHSVRSKGTHLRVVPLAKPLALNDPNSDFNPQNSSGPYYGKLLPLRKIRIYADTEVDGNPVEVNLFSGYITSYDTGFYSGVYTTSTVVLQCVDGFRLLNNASTPVDAGDGLDGNHTLPSRARRAASIAFARRIHARSVSRETPNCATNSAYRAPRARMSAACRWSAKRGPDW